MRLRQMFPSQSLDAEDLRAYNPGITIVTIEKIDYKTKESNRIGELEIFYYLKVREFKKPFKLNKTVGGQLADLLETDETDHWIGQVVGITPVQVEIPDAETKRKKKIWCINVDLVKPTTPPVLPPNTDITGAADEQRGRAGLPVSGSHGTLPGAAEKTPMGIDQAAKVVAGLHERGKSPDDFVRYLISIDKGDMATGKQPYEWPIATVEWARRFCKMFPKTREAPASFIDGLKRNWSPPAQEPTKVTEVVDRSTGEVTTVPPKPADVHQPGGFDPGYEPIDEDDIPF